MRSIVTNKEVNNYYNRLYLLHPLYMGLIFSVVIFILYNLVYLIIGLEFSLEWNYILIGFGLGFLEGLSTLFINYKLNNKKMLYFSNLERKGKSDIFIPVILDEGFLKKSHGVLIVGKDNIEFRVQELFENKTLFTIPNKEIDMQIVRKNNSLFKQIISLYKESNILLLKSGDKEYQFVVPCSQDATHRLAAHRI